MTINQLKYIIAISKVNSINEAAKKLYISQPSLTNALQSLENEVGFDIFIRSKSGISLTVKGAEFLGYAKSVVKQYEILDAKYISKSNTKRAFHVSMQHLRLYEQTESVGRANRSYNGRFRTISVSFIRTGGLQFLLFCRRSPKHI